jgi:enamine deaminase RidA (YjgF/YER057c/UK114 family)
MAPTPTERLRELGLSLPPPPKPVGAYAPVVVDGNHAWVSGQVVLKDGVAVSAGHVDGEVPVEAAKAVARAAVLQALSALSASLGSIDRILRVVRVVVYVATSPGFARHSEVGNGATELLVQLFGEEGRPARVSVGVSSLPLNAPVELELLVAIG